MSGGGNGVRVLVVDDDPQILRALRINLTAHGYTVLVAADGSAALRVAADGHPDFTVDLAAKTVVRADGAEVHLTPTEWGILELLVRHRGKLVEQKRLLREVWGPQYGTETHYLRVYLAQLRRKLEPVPSRPKYLITEAGMGYRFDG